MEVRRIGPDGGFLREFTDVRKRVQHLETRPSGNIVIRETLTATDPATGVSTQLGVLPDGSIGFQPFIGDIVPPPVATQPIVSAQPGIFTVSWDGLFVNNEEKPRDFEHVNVIAHKMDGTTTTLSLVAGVLRLPSDSVIVTQEIAAIGETWQFSLESEDYNGNLAARGDRSPSIVMQSTATDEGVTAALEALQADADAAQATANTAQTNAGTAQTAASAAQTTANTAVTNAQTADGKAVQALADALAASNLAATKGKVLYQSSAPTGVDANTQTLWIDTTSNLNTPKRWVSGTTWTTVTDKVATDAAALAATKGKILYQTSAPTGADANELTLWIDTTGGANTPKKWVSGTTWTSLTDKVASDAAALAATKGKILFQTTAPTGADASLLTLWIDTTGGINKPMKWVSGTTWVAITDKVALDAATAAANAATAASNAQGTANTAVTNAATAQTKADQAFNNAATAATAAGTAQTTADGKNRVWYLDTEPAGTSHQINDLWFDTNDGNKPYRWTGTIWSTIQDTSIAAAKAVADAAYSISNGKNTTYYQPGQPSGGTYILGDLWFDTDAAYKLYTYNGSIWQATQDAAGAQAAAISSAATDATTKSTNAQTAAIAAAATDATTKSTNAQTAAINAAATDATTKADLAQLIAIQAQAYSLNPSFDDWTGTYPASFSAWSSVPVKETSIKRKGNNALRFNVAAAGDNAGIALASTLAHAPNIEYYTVEVDIYLVSGTFSGAGVLLDWNGITPYRTVLKLGDEIPTPIVGKWYRVVKTLRRPTATGTWGGMAGYLMANYSENGTMAVKDIIFDWFNVRPSTTEEITAYGSAAAISTAVSTKNKNYYETSQPTGGTYLKGDLWFDTDDNYKLYTHTGSTWQATQDAAAALYNSQLYVQSRGMDLVTNGNGQLGNNTNFTTLEYNRTDTPTGAVGVFETTAISGSSVNDELIRVDPAKSYQFRVSAKQKTAGVITASYTGLAPYDNAGLSIMPNHYMEQFNTRTTLAVTLSPGATTITLASSANWNNAGGVPNTHLRSMIAWNYVDAFGKTWAPGTYSRNHYNDLYNEGGISGNVITLKTPWAGPTIASGTAVSNGSSGGNYMYTGIVNITLPNAWTDYTGTVGGVHTELYGAATTKFPMATASVRVLFLFNRAVGANPTTGSRHAFGNISLSEVSGANLEVGSVTNDKIASINADKITAGTVAADRLSANTIRAKLIEADYISAVDIFAQNSITSASGIFGEMNASVINAGTIAADRLDAETVKAKLIEASLINAVDIIAQNSITATNGIIGSLDVSKVTAGTMSGSFITAKTITTDRLVITSTDNLVVEADFKNNGSSWALGANNTINATAGRGVLPAMRFTGTVSQIFSGNLVNRVSVGTEDRFRASLYVKSDAALAADTVQIRLRCYTTATAYTDITAATNVLLVANTWTNVSGISPALPAGTIAIEVFLAVTNNATGTITDIDYVAVTRAADGKLVVDGAMDAKSITGATIKTAASGARVLLDTTGIYGYDSLGVNYLSGTAAGLSLTGQLKAHGVTDDDINPEPMTIVTGNLDMPDTSWDPIGIHFVRDGWQLGTYVYVPPRMFSFDGTDLQLQSATIDIVNQNPITYSSINLQQGGHAQLHGSDNAFVTAGNFIQLQTNAAGGDINLFAPNVVLGKADGTSVVTMSGASIDVQTYGTAGITIESGGKINLDGSSDGVFMDGAVYIQDRKVVPVRFYQSTIVASYPPHGTLWGPGQFTMNAGASFHGDFVDTPGNDLIDIIETGVYTFEFVFWPKFTGTDDYVRALFQKQNGGTWETLIAGQREDKSWLWEFSISRTTHVVAGSRFRLVFQHESGATQQWDTQVMVTKVR